MANDCLPRLQVTVYSDYVCPFCYIGERRIARLEEQFDVQVTWRGVEIHPETPPQGMALSELGYPPDVWDKMMMHLGNMAAEEGLVLAERTHTFNSHKALLVAEAAKQVDAEVFRELHEGLFHAFFSQGKNFSDPDVLRQIALNAGMEEADFERALIEPEFEDALRENYAAARKHGVTGVPTFVIGEQVISGAVPTSSLILLAREAMEQLAD